MALKTLLEHKRFKFQNGLMVLQHLGYQMNLPGFPRQIMYLIIQVKILIEDPPFFLLKVYRLPKVFLRNYKMIQMIQFSKTQVIEVDCLMAMSFSLMKVRPLIVIALIDHLDFASFQNYFDQLR